MNLSNLGKACKQKKERQNNTGGSHLFLGLRGLKFGTKSPIALFISLMDQLPLLHWLSGDAASASLCFHCSWSK